MKRNEIERLATPLILVCAFLFAVAVAYRIGNQPGLRPGPEALSLLNDLILLLTAVVLIFYTYETYKLREAAQRQIEVAQNQLTEAQRQTELQLRPFVIDRKSVV